MQSNYAYISLHGLMLSTQAYNKKTASVLRILLSVSALIWPLTTQSTVGAELPNAQRTHTDRSHWLTLEGETRARFETLDGQFRANGKGGDQLLALRTLLRAEARLPRSTTNQPNWPPITLGFELQDSRTYLGDEGTPLSSSYTNPLDVLQLYARADNLPSVIDNDATSHLTHGRQTVSIGSKRQIERVSYANVIKSYTGAHWVSHSGQDDQLHAIYVVPINRRPSIQTNILDNELKSDKEQWQRR